jgi:hypothetical protein
MNRLSNYRTTWTEANGAIVVCYVKTNIVVTDSAGNVTLNSDGWQTVTTKRKMNQAARQFALGYGVHQVKGVWYVDVWSQALTKWLGLKMPFHDGMTFNPRELRMKHNAELALA